jgi:hypothetical protein
MPVSRGNRRQEDGEFEASSSYMAKFYLKTKQKVFILKGY